MMACMRPHVWSTALLSRLNSWAWTLSSRVQQQHHRVGTTGSQQMLLAWTGTRRSAGISSHDGKQNISRAIQSPFQQAGDLRCRQCRLRWGRSSRRSHLQFTAGSSAGLQRMRTACRRSGPAAEMHMSPWSQRAPARMSMPGVLCFPVLPAATRDWAALHSLLCSG